MRPVWTRAKPIPISRSRKVGDHDGTWNCQNHQQAETLQLTRELTYSPAERNKVEIPIENWKRDGLLGPATCSANHPTCKYCIYTKMPHPPGSWCYMFKAGTRVNRGDKIWCAKYEGVCQGCGMKLTVVVDDLCATCAGNRRGAQPDERKNQ